MKASQMPITRFRNLRGMSLMKIFKLLLILQKDTPGYLLT